MLASRTAAGFNRAVYRVQSYIVTQRSREIGLRMALGASASTVVGMVVTRGLALTGAGLTIRLSVAAADAVRTMLYGVDTIDPAIFTTMAVLLCATAVLACCLPAWRASRVDPIVVLEE